MARFNQTRKRSRPQSGRVLKRRRFSRFKRNARRIRSSGSGGVNLPFRARKLSKSRYRRSLWNATQHLTHYRAEYTNTAAVNTPASFSDPTTVSHYADEAVGGDSFTFPNGGLLIADTGITPVFTGGNIVRRGGQYNLTIFNNVENDAAHGDNIGYNIALIRCSYGFDKTALDAIVPQTFSSLNAVHDFRQRFGTIVVQKNGVLKQEESVSISWRAPIQKIDWGSYNGTKKGPSKLVWWITVRNGFGNAVQSCRYKYGYSISFTGDATA